MLVGDGLLSWLFLYLILYSLLLLLSDSSGPVFPQWSLKFHLILTLLFEPTWWALLNIYSAAWDETCKCCSVFAQVLLQGKLGHLCVDNASERVMILKSDHRYLGKTPLLINLWCGNATWICNLVATVIFSACDTWQRSEGLFSVCAVISLFRSH